MTMARYTYFGIGENPPAQTDDATTPNVIEEKHCAALIIKGAMNSIGARRVVNSLPIAYKPDSLSVGDVYTITVSDPIKINHAVFKGVIELGGSNFLHFEKDRIDFWAWADMVHLER